NLQVSFTPCLTEAVASLSQNLFRGSASHCWRCVMRRCRTSLRNNRNRIVMAAALAAGFIHAQTGSAASHTWTGATDNNWGTAANWTINAGPNATTEDVSLVAPGATNLSINANTGTYTVRSLTFNHNT